MKFTASEIAEQVGGEVVGDGGIELAGFAQADAAKPGDLTFAENEKYFRLAEESPASAILAPEEFASETKTVIRVKNARIAFARVLPLLFPEKEFAPGIHPSAVIADSAQVAGTAHIGPNCVIGESAAIGEQTVLEANCTVGDHSVLGQARLPCFWLGTSFVEGYCFARCRQVDFPAVARDLQLSLDLNIMVKEPALGL
jgi:UDP-3-O-[3-hydroxymyristoyl] glucosamine N-acyltransferase